MTIDRLAHLFYEARQIGLLATRDVVRQVAFGKIQDPWLKYLSVDGNPGIESPESSILFGGYENLIARVGHDLLLFHNSIDLVCIVGGSANKTNRLQ